MPTRSVFEFSDAQVQISVRSGQTSNSLNFNHFLVTCKNEECPIKIDIAGVAATFLPLYVYSDFSRRSRACNSAVRDRIWQNFKLIREFMVVFVSYKNEVDPIKSEGARAATRLYADFSDAEGQIIP